MPLRLYLRTEVDLEVGEIRSTKRRWRLTRMDPRLLRLYNRELQYVRELGGEFAKEFPKIAGRLGLEGFECVDPYVERLLEGFAFLTARVQLNSSRSFRASRSTFSRPSSRTTWRRPLRWRWFSFSRT